MGELVRAGRGLSGELVRAGRGLLGELVRAGRGRQHGGRGEPRQLPTSIFRNLPSVSSRFLFS